MNNHLLLQRPVTGISFKLITLVEPKLLNFAIFDTLVCKIRQEAGGRTNDTIFVDQLSRAITGVIALGSVQLSPKRTQPDPDPKGLKG